MLLIPDTQIKIFKPEEIHSLPVEIKNYLFHNLRKGLVFFVVPEDLKMMDRNEQVKKHIKNHKIGFLFDCLSILYPELGKQDKYSIIDLDYQTFITYRQFKSLLDLYIENREVYLERRNDLQHLQ